MGSIREERHSYELRGRYKCGAIVHVARLVTSHAVVEWCDRYTVHPVTHQATVVDPPRTYEGAQAALPADPAAKHRKLDEVYAWIDRTRGAPTAGMVQLARGEAPSDAVVYDEGFLGLTVTDTEFTAIQRWWAAFGLPTDLCCRWYPYPADDDPLDVGDSLDDLARRRRAFVQASGRYLTALSVRISPLWQEWPGDAEEGQLVEHLTPEVGRAMLHSLRLVDDWRSWI